MSGQWHVAHGVRTETLFAVGASSRGTLMTAGTSNAKGAYITAVATTFAYEHIIVGLSTSSAAADYCVDIAIGSAGNEWVVCADLLLASRKGAGEAFVWYEIPVHVPNGASLTARCSSSTNSATCSVIVIGFSSGYNGLPGFSRLIALYAPATSRGVAVDPGTSAGTKARTQIIASSAQRVGGILFHIGQNADVARTATATAMYDVETGSAGNERILIADLPLSWGPTNDGPSNFSFPPVPCDVPTAQRFSVNMKCDDATAGDRTIDFALWGLVP